MWLGPVLAICIPTLKLHNFDSAEQQVPGKFHGSDQPLNPAWRVIVAKKSSDTKYCVAGFASVLKNTKLLVEATPNGSPQRPNPKRLISRTAVEVACFYCIFPFRFRGVGFRA